MLPFRELVMDLYAVFFSHVDHFVLPFYLLLVFGLDMIRIDMIRNFVVSNSSPLFCYLIQFFLIGIHRLSIVVMYGVKLILRHNFRLDSTIR